MSDLKTLVQELLAHDPSKEQELREIYPSAFSYDLFSLARKMDGNNWDVFGVNSEEHPCIRIDVNDGEQCFLLDADHEWEIRSGYYLHVKPKQCQPQP